MRVGDLPMQKFTLKEWSAMPVWIPACDGSIAPNGFSRVRRVNGAPSVVYRASINSGDISYVVHPVVRVPMGRREVRNYTLADFCEQILSPMVRKYELGAA